MADMEQVRVFERPLLRKPVMVAAFAGWNDAAQAATSAVRFLQRRWSAPLFADIEPDEFFNFTETRPTVHITKGAIRKIEWPATEWFYHHDPNDDRDFVLLIGVEPQLKWRTFVQAVLRLSKECGVETLVTLGAMLADVPHTAPTSLVGFSNERSLSARMQRLNTQSSDYQGPTGIVGVLNALAAEQGMRTASLWGTVPTYLSAIPNPRVTLALLQRLAGLLDLSVPLGGLEEMSRHFDQQVADAIANNPQIASYVQQLEGREQVKPSTEQRNAPIDPPGGTPSATPDLPSGRALVEDIEDFLRRQRGQGD